MRLQKAAVGPLVVLLVAIMGGAASAFPAPTMTEKINDADEWVDCGSKIEANFTGGWDTTVKLEARAAFDDWESVPNKTGGKLVDIRVNAFTGSTAVDILMDPTLASQAAFASCGPDTDPNSEDDDKRILFSTFYDDTDPDILDKFHGVARHEMGHILEMGHTGEVDNLAAAPDDGPSSLSTCGPDAEDLILSSEDHGALHHKHNTSSSPPITPDLGIEDGIGIWGDHNVNVTAVATSAEKHVGSWSLKFTPTSSSGYVAHRVNYADSDGRDIDTKIAFKKGVGSGKVKVNIFKREIEYSTLGCSGVFFVGRNQNSRVGVSNWIQVTGAYKEWTATTSWQEKSTSDSTVSYDSNEQAVDLELRIYSTVLQNGDYQSVWIDQVRIRDVD